MVDVLRMCTQVAALESGDVNMVVVAAIIAMLALFNAWLAGLEKYEVLYLGTVVYWVLVCFFWLIKMMVG